MSSNLCHIHVERLGKPKEDLERVNVKVDGNTNGGGRGPGVWDIFAAEQGTIADGTTPKTTCDHFNRYKEDIADMKKLGLMAYRFSISWPRLFPESSENVNQKGLAFYNDLIDCVVESGLTPFVTLYHWDLPQYLQDDPDVKGFSTKQIIKHFLIFAETCFKAFGNRVKNWITFNEIHLHTILTYHVGIMAPGKPSDSNITCYTIAHNMLLCHAASVKLYRTTYQEHQKGLIGLTAEVFWYEPMHETDEDKSAVNRCNEFEMGWILDPVMFGEYPKLMRELVGIKLPQFTKEESLDLKGSIDFLGLNYYSAMWATSITGDNSPYSLTWLNESMSQCYWKNADGKPMGEITGFSHNDIFRSCPWGLSKVLMSLKKRYGDIPIYITENGTVDPTLNGVLDGPVNDEYRIKFLKDHLSEILSSIRSHVNVKGYFHWSFMDNWEWMAGFTLRFGLFYIDFNDPCLRRQPKSSAKWLSSFLKS